MRKSDPPKAPGREDPRFDEAWKRIQKSSRRYGRMRVLTARTFLTYIYGHEVLAAYLSRRVRRRGLTRAGLNVLVILRDSEGKGCRHHEISEMLLVSRANVTGLIESLIRLGLVERFYDKSDRRVCIARITKKGEDLLDSFLPAFHALIEKIFSGLTSSEKKDLNRIMKKLSAVIKELDGETPRG